MHLSRTIVLRRLKSPPRSSPPLKRGASRSSFGEEVAQRAAQLYQTNIRAAVEIEGNIGKMAIVDVETGEYHVDLNGIESARYLRQKNPMARLFGIRIGYNVAASFGGVMEHTAK